MNERTNRGNTGKPTLFDRLVMGGFSGFVAFITFGILWAILSRVAYVGAAVLLPIYFLWVPSLF